MRTTIKLIYSNTKEYLGQEIQIEGWIRNSRGSKAFGFIELNDGKIGRAHV